MEPIQSVKVVSRERDLVTKQVTKYEAWLNLHGGKQELGVNYFETYAQVATWMAICFSLIVAIELLVLQANRFCYGMYTSTYRM